MSRFESSSWVVVGGERERKRPSLEDLEGEGMGCSRAAGGGVRRVEVVVEVGDGEETGRGGRPRSKVSVEILETIWRWKAEE